ncbi:zinc ribbon domain-containing protein [bacterium]|nr:zinc ribbon domain-containing protein [bacterium]MBU1984072.1 zinc ribbon domain-containing protein [bacterium]
MPIYDYQCHNCGGEFEELRKISDHDEDVACPHCGEKDCERQISLTACDTSSGGCGGGGGSFRPMRFG